MRADRGAQGRRAPIWRSPITGNVLALIAFLIVTVDEPISRMLRQVEPWVLDVFKVLTEAGDSVWYLVPSGLIVLIGLALSRFVKARQTKRISAWSVAASGFLFAAVAVSGLTVDVLKPLFGRARPALLERHEFYGFQPLTFDSAYYSFPSGHANTAMVVALVLAYLCPRQRHWLIGIGAFFAFTRVVVNAHYLSDTVAGAAIAFMTTSWLSAWFAGRGWVFEANGRKRRRLQAPGRLIRMRATRAFRGRFARALRRPFLLAARLPPWARHARSGDG